MFRAGAMAAFQAAGPDGGVSLTLGPVGVVGLLTIFVAAATGWVFFVLSRRAKTPSATPMPTPSVAPDPAPEPTPPRPARPDRSVADPAEAAFLGLESGLADVALLFRDHRLARAGAGARSMFGEQSDLLGGARLVDLSEAEDLLPVAEAVRVADRFEANGVETRFMLRGVTGLRGARDVEARIVRPVGCVPGTYIVTLSDVTAPLARARTAAEMASRMDAALNLLEDGVMMTRREEGREVVIFFNSGMERLLGVSAEAAVGRPLTEVLASAENFDDVDLQSLFRAPDTPLADLIETTGEDARLIDRVSRPLVTSFGPGGHLFILKDVTAERAREEELRAVAVEASGAREGIESVHQDLLLANEGLERRLADLVRLNRQLKGLDEMKSNLLANVSHELQTPLVSIRGYTEMMLKGRLGAVTGEQDKGLRVALRNIDRLIALIDGLLTFARAEKESEKLRIESFALRPLVDETVDLLKEPAAAKKVRISVLFPSGDLVVRGDRDRLAQVFINLLSNAVKYNQDGGSVVVEVGKGTRAQARIEVKDTGIGIPRDDLERIFDRYYRTGPAREEKEGSGLGLAITKDILRLHGCMIRADSEPGKGSTFSFTLPLEGRARPDRHPRPPGAPREE
ncbi:MAG: hypothetical protein HY049_18845 [Acidobacteria bacterium]|nr:hypothetical protein [Acidobacteriota bacterium]